MRFVALEVFRKFALDDVLEKFEKYVDEFNVKSIKDCDVDEMKNAIIALSERKPYVKVYPDRIRVYNSFSIKDELKRRGFSFNSFEKCWEKRVKKLLENENYLKIHSVKIDEVEELKKMNVPVLSPADWRRLESFFTKVSMGGI